MQKVTRMRVVETVQDYREQAALHGYRAISPQLEPNCRIMRGANGTIRLRSGLILHFSEATDLDDVRLEADCPPNISVKLFLSGRVEARIGEFEIPMPQRIDQLWEPVAVLLAQPRSERFVRECSKGTQLRKVSVSFTNEWLQSSGLFSDEDAEVLGEFSRCHLAHRSWSPSPLAVATAEQILSAPDMSGLLLSLYYESRALILVTEALQQVLTPDARTEERNISPLDSRKLAEINAFVDRTSGDQITSERLADVAGASVNTLRRLIRRAHGTSLINYIRRRKLISARTALETKRATIAEAAHIAGYSSTANFSTAFKREFGLAPSQTRLAVR